MADSCQQCGKPLAHPRTGSPPKRFCSGACRARAARGRQGRAEPTVIGPPSPSSRAERRATFQAIYDELKADIESRGAVIDGRVNPSVEAIRRIGAELERYSAVVEEAKLTDAVDAALRIA